MKLNYVNLQYRDDGQLDPSTTAAINASASTLSSDAAIIAQSSINRATRNWNNQMYDKQRANALADRDFQNAYNAPQKQMERLKVAGLNPNLIYGSGTDAASTSATPRAASVQSWNPQAPTGAIMNLGNSVAAYQDVMMKQAQTNNLQAENAKIIASTGLTTAQTVGENASTDLKQVNTASAAFDLDYKNDLREISADTAEAALRKLQTDITISLDANDRAALSNAMEMRKGELSLKDAAITILNKKLQSGQIAASTANTQMDTGLKYEQMQLPQAQRDEIQQKITNLKTSNTLDNLDARLKANGIQPGDSGWERWLEIIMSQFAKGVTGKGGTIPLH